MTARQEEKIKELLIKYNDVLLMSMKLAVSDDFTKLLISNKDDSDFELSNLLKQKEQFTNHVMKEFLRINSSSVTKGLSEMEVPELKMGKKSK